MLSRNFWIYGVIRISRSAVESPASTRARQVASLARCWVLILIWLIAKWKRAARSLKLVSVLGVNVRHGHDALHDKRRHAGHRATRPLLGGRCVAARVRSRAVMARAGAFGRSTPRLFPMLVAPDAAPRIASCRSSRTIACRSRRRGNRARLSARKSPSRNRPSSRARAADVTLNRPTPATLCPTGLAKIMSLQMERSS